MLKPLLALVALASCLPAQAQVNIAVRYLDCESGDDLNDGKTAATAKRTLQAALAGVPDGCTRPVEVNILPGECVLEPPSSPSPTGSPCLPLPSGCFAVGLWPDTRLLGAGSAASFISTSKSIMRFTDRPECAPGGPRFVLQGFTLDINDDQYGGIALPHRDVFQAREVGFYNATTIAGPVRVAISNSWFSAGVGLGPANGYIKNTGFGGNEINDANDQLLSVTVRPGGKLVVSDSQLRSGYFYNGVIGRCSSGGALVLEHNTFSLPPSGAVTVFGSTACDVHVLRNQFFYDSYWDPPGLGVQVVDSNDVAVDVSGNLFDGAESEYTALSVASDSDVDLDVAYNTIARSSTADAVTLAGEGAGDIRIRGNAFHAIGGAAIRVSSGLEKPEVTFNNFDGVGDALCLDSTCLATGQEVNGSGAGGGNLDLPSGFQSPGAFPADFHLTATSPLIDAGDPEDQTPRLDLDGTLRPADGDADEHAVCDIGAFEFLPPPPARRMDALSRRR